MTRYEKLLLQGRQMSEKEIEDSVRGMSADPRFAAFIGMIAKIKDDTADASCDPKYAPADGYLAHAAGTRFGLVILEGKLKKAMEPPKRTGSQRPEQE